MTANVERRLLSLIRSQYEANGYLFYEYPQRDLLPPFLQGHRPDAIALGSPKNVAIEVKLHRRTSDRALEKLSGLFKDQPDWELRVLYGDDFEIQPASIPSSQVEIERQIDEAESLLKSGHERAALVLAWAALEAASRSIPSDESQVHSRSPSQVLEILERMGRLEFQRTKVLRGLLALRNAAVHGDYNTAITKADVESVLSAARTANTA
jgi:uncharacterized protein YutE (UPF0331/DUF86 family)